MSNDTPKTRLATRLGFIIAGFAMACWAPLVPIAKANVGVDDAGFGLLLLCLGAGSLVAMPATGWLASRHGSRPLIVAGALGLVVLLPMLALAGSAVALAVALAFFGAALGLLDVAINIHAVEVERDATRPLMSGFHAMFSIGGFAGAAGMTLLLSLGMAPAWAAGCGSLLSLLMLVLAAPHLLRAKAGEPVPFSWPRGTVLLIAVLAGITFLVEGAVLDWGALLIVARDLLGAEQSGIGYMLFAGAMTIGRLSGDRVVLRVGSTKILIAGGILAAFGILLTLGAPFTGLALAGFVLIGLGASNIVPVLFSAAGRQSVMPPALAIAAVTTVGYAGILLGPALLGFVAQIASLPAAFVLLAALICIIPLAGPAVTRPRR